MTKTVVGITGMSCANCASRIERAISELDGIEAATVNLVLEEMVVTHDEMTISTAVISREVENLGYGVVAPAPDGEVTFGVGGLRCASCVSRLESALREDPAISEVVVNLATETALVRYDSQRLGIDEIFAMVMDAGYTPSEQQPKDTDPARDEQRSEFKWLVFSVLASLPVMATMGMHDNRAVMQFNCLLATLVQFSAGLMFYRGAWVAAKNQAATMDTLVALGTSAAYFYSLLAYAGLFGPAPDIFFETSVMLIAFIRLGKFLEARARGKAGEVLKKLLRLQTDKASLLTDEGEKETPVSLIRVGDVVVVRPGEIIPVDGEIIDGSGSVDESMVTGESMPVLKNIGDCATGTTINKNGMLRVRATRIGESTLLSQIVRMAREAQGDKAPIQRFADTVSGWFVPVVMMLVLITFFVWFFALNAPFATALKFAIAVVVIACPCAMGLATPTAIMVGSGVALNRGILIKRGSVLEIISRLQVVLLDKTGTLTTGSPAMTDLVAVKGVDRDRLLECLATAEAYSNHPLAQAVLKAAESAGIKPGEAENFEERSGYGITCGYAGFNLVVGNERLMREEGISLKPLVSEIGELYGEGKSLIFVAGGGTLVGVAAFADALKPTSRRAIEKLRSMGIKTCMITGDHNDVASKIAAQTGVDFFEAELLPGRKQELVKEYQLGGAITAMVGDGINDAPALAQADIGIAIGGGSDIAREAGDIVLMRDDLMDVARAITIGRTTLAKIKQNLFWALFYNALGIPVAAGVFSSFGLVLRPELAGLAMALSSVSVVLNSIMIKRVEREL